MNRARLENWSLVGSDFHMRRWLLEKYPAVYLRECFVLPTEDQTRLHGQIYEDSRRLTCAVLEGKSFADGEFVRTSFIDSFTRNRAVTKNTVYTLSEPSAEYQNWLIEQKYELLT